jgi:hypothetical protein
MLHATNLFTRSVWYFDTIAGHTDASVPSWHVKSNATSLQRWTQNKAVVVAHPQCEQSICLDDARQLVLSVALITFLMKCLRLGKWKIWEIWNNSCGSGWVGKSTTKSITIWQQNRFSTSFILRFVTCIEEYYGYEQWKCQMHQLGFFCGLKKRSLLGSAVSNEGRVEAVSEVVKKTSSSLGVSPVTKKKMT